MKHKSEKGRRKIRLSGSLRSEVRRHDVSERVENEGLSQERGD